MEVVIKSLCLYAFCWYWLTQYYWGSRYMHMYMYHWFSTCIFNDILWVRQSWFYMYVGRSSSTRWHILQSWIAQRAIKKNNKYEKMKDEVGMAVHITSIIYPYASFLSCYGTHAGMDNQYWLPMDFSYMYMHRVKIWWHALTYWIRGAWYYWEKQA